MNLLSFAQGGDSDFDCDSEEDDEATIAAQERDAGHDAAAVQAEIAQLRADQEVPVEELRRRYAGAAGAGESEDGSTDGRDAVGLEVCTVCSYFSYDSLGSAFC